MGDPSHPDEERIMVWLSSVCSRILNPEAIPLICFTVFRGTDLKQETQFIAQARLCPETFHPDFDSLGYINYCILEFLEKPGWKRQI